MKTTAYMVGLCLFAASCTDTKWRTVEILAPRECEAATAYPRADGAEGTLYSDFFDYGGACGVLEYFFVERADGSRVQVTGDEHLLGNHLFESMGFHGAAADVRLCGVSPLDYLGIEVHEISIPSCGAWLKADDPYPAHGRLGVETNVILSVCPPLDARNFLFYLAEGSGSFSLLANVDGAYPNVAVTLAPATLYRWKVLAYSNCGQATASDVWTFTTG